LMHACAPARRHGNPLRSPCRARVGGTKTPVAHAASSLPSRPKRSASVSARRAAHRATSRALDAAAERAFPSGEVGPVLAPPCIRHRAFAGRCRAESHTHPATHGLPARVRAPQRGRSRFHVRGVASGVACRAARARRIAASARSTLLMVTSVLPTVRLRKGF
jgi:hypothetical protein